MFSPTYPLFFGRPSQLPRETCLAIAKPAVLEVSKPGKQRGLGSQAEYLPARLTANIHQELTAKEDAAFVFKSNVEIGQERTRACPFCTKHFTHMSHHVATCKQKKRKEGEEEERKGKGKGKGKGTSNFGA